MGLGLLGPGGSAGMTENHHTQEAMQVWSDNGVPMSVRAARRQGRVAKILSLDHAAPKPDSQGYCER